MSGWSGIPRKYHPMLGRPWRVSWGIGSFQDFDTFERAQAFYVGQVKKLEMIEPPFYVNFDGAFYPGEPEYDEALNQEASCCI